MHLISQVAMTDPSPKSTPACSNLLLDLNVNMDLNPKMNVYGYMHNVKYKQPHTLHEPVFFKPIRQIIVHNAMFKVTSFVDHGPYLKLFNPLENHINYLKEKLNNIVTNPSHKFMKSDLSKVIDQVPP